MHGAGADTVLGGGPRVHRGERVLLAVEDRLKARGARVGRGGLRGELGRAGPRELWGQRGVARGLRGAGREDAPRRTAGGWGRRSGRWVPRPSPCARPRRRPQRGWRRSSARRCAARWTSCTRARRRGRAARRCSGCRRRARAEKRRARAGGCRRGGHGESAYSRGRRLRRRRRRRRDRARVRRGVRNGPRLVREAGVDDDQGCRGGARTGGDRGGPAEGGGRRLIPLGNTRVFGTRRSRPPCAWSSRVCTPSWSRS